MNSTQEKKSLACTRKRRMDNRQKNYLHKNGLEASRLLLPPSPWAIGFLFVYENYSSFPRAINLPGAAGFGRTSNGSPLATLVKSADSCGDRRVLTLSIHRLLQTTDQSSDRCGVMCHSNVGFFHLVANEYSPRRELVTTAAPAGWIHQVVRPAFGLDKI